MTQKCFVNSMLDMVHRYNRNANVSGMTKEIPDQIFGIPYIEDPAVPPGFVVIQDGESIKVFKSPS